MTGTGQRPPQPPQGGARAAPQPTQQPGQPGQQQPGQQPGRPADQPRQEPNRQPPGRPPGRQAPDQDEGRESERKKDLQPGERPATPRREARSEEEKPKWNQSAHRLEGGALEKPSSQMAAEQAADWDWQKEPRDWSTVPTNFSPEAYSTSERNSTTEERRGLAAIKILNRAGYIDTTPTPPTEPIDQQVARTLGVKPEDDVNHGYVPLESKVDPEDEKPPVSEPRQPPRPQERADQRPNA